MKLLPDSIRTRTILVLLIGLTASHFGSTIIYSADRDHAVTTAMAADYADHLATLAKLIDSSPASTRRQMTEAVSCPALQVSWGPETDFSGTHAEDVAFTPIRDALRPYFGPLGDDRLHVVFVQTQDSAPSGRTLDSHHAKGHIGDLQVQAFLRLNDGSWSNFRLTVPTPSAGWTLQPLLSTLAMMLTTLLIAMWASGWITAPLAAFAHAAERLGLDVNAQPMPEDGPQEVRAAARAFNGMQQRIRSFVDDRLQMLAAISHDLRTPITRLRLRTEQLPIEPTQQDRMLADLDEMEQMIASSLDFAKGEAAGEPSQAIDLAALLGTICDDAADAGYQADFDWDGRLVYVGRPLAMKRLFSNLVDNALRYGHSAKVRGANTADGVEVIVEDEGTGIPADELETVFKPFYRLEHSRNKQTGGIGLGLANARTIARAHGGDVRLENKTGGGLRVIVTLPHHHEDSRGTKA